LEERTVTKIHTILHPTDFSEPAEYAFQVACSLARDHGAQLLLLHVISPPLTHGEALARAAPDSYRDQLWRELERIKKRDASVKTELLLEEGHPAKVIVQTANENGCDLIVMGTHGRTGLRRLLMGSVAEEVLRGVGCPMLTVKTPLPKDVPEGTAQIGEQMRS
jgi:nucleotide-binding universal stress UspA family protein